MILRGSRRRAEGPPAGNLQESDLAPQGQRGLCRLRSLIPPLRWLGAGATAAALFAIAHATPAMAADTGSTLDSVAATVSSTLDDPPQPTPPPALTIPDLTTALPSVPPAITKTLIDAQQPQLADAAKTTFGSVLNQVPTPLIPTVSDVAAVLPARLAHPGANPGAPAPVAGMDGHPANGLPSPEGTARGSDASVRLAQRAGSMMPEQARETPGDSASSRGSLPAPPVPLPSLPSGSAGFGSIAPQTGLGLSTLGAVAAVTVLVLLTAAARAALRVVAETLTPAHIVSAIERPG